MNTSLSESSLFESKIHVIWGGLLIAIPHGPRILICHGRTMERIKVLSTSSRVLHLAELKFSRTNNPLLTVEENGHVNKWDIAGGWCTKLRRLKGPCMGIICVEELRGLLICGEGEELVLYTRPHYELESQPLIGPKGRILGAVFVKELSGLVTYGESGEVFFFERHLDRHVNPMDQPRRLASGAALLEPACQGRRLNVPAARVTGVMYAHKLGGMMVYGAGGEVFGLKTHVWEQGKHCVPEELQQELLRGTARRINGDDQTRSINGAVCVELFGGVVTYGADGEIFLFESLEKEGRRLLGPTQSILGVHYVKELRSLVSYGYEGEVYLFENSYWEGRQLKGPTNGVIGAIYVRKFGGLVTYGESGEVYLFNKLQHSIDFDSELSPSRDPFTGHKMLGRDGPEESIQEALFVKEYEGLVTYGLHGELYIFREAEKEGQLLSVTLTRDLSHKFQIKGAMYVEELKGLVTYKDNRIQLCDFADSQGNRLVTPAGFEDDRIHATSDDKWLEASAFVEGRTLRGPKDKINGVVYVKEFNGLVSFGGHGEIWLFERKEIEYGWKLNGPKHNIHGSLYLCEFGGLVTYGHNGEVFLFKTALFKPPLLNDEEGQHLKGPKCSLQGAIYVKELGGLVVYGGHFRGSDEGEGEVFLFESSEREGQRLEGPTKFVRGVLYVKELGGLVTYGGDGEVFLHNSSKQGLQLNGPRENVNGVVYVAELGGLVTYGAKGEVFVFKGAAQEGVCLKGPRETICGAIYVKELEGLLTWGHHRDIFFFRSNGQVRLEREGATQQISRATYLKEFGGVMVYGGRGEAFLFEGSDLVRRRGSGHQDLESQIQTIKGRPMLLKISSDIRRVFEVGKSIVFQGGHYLEIFFNAAGDVHHIRSNSMLVEHMENVFSVERIDEEQLLTVTDTGASEGMKVLFVKDLDRGFLGEGPYTKQGSTSILDLPQRQPLLSVKLEYCMEILFMMISYYQLASFASNGRVKQVIQQLPLHSFFLGNGPAETTNPNLVTSADDALVLKSSANVSVTVSVLLLALFYYHQWLMNSTLIERKSWEFKGKLANMVNALLKYVLKLFFVPLMKDTVLGIQAYGIDGQFVMCFICLLSAVSLYAWTERMIRVEYTCKWTSALARTPWSRTWDKKIGPKDRLVVRRHPLSHKDIEFDVQKSLVKTLLCLIASLFEQGPFKNELAVSILNVVVGGLFLRLSLKREDYFRRTGLRWLTGNCINRSTAASIQAIYVCSLAYALACRFNPEYSSSNAHMSFVILIFLVPTITVAFLSASCTCTRKYLKKEKARKLQQERSLSLAKAQAVAQAVSEPESEAESEADSEADAGSSSSEEPPARQESATQVKAEEAGLNQLQKRWADLQARWTKLDSEYDVLEKQLDVLLCKLDAPLLG